MELDSERTWLNEGYIFGYLTSTEWIAGGTWVIGNRDLPHWHPGRTDGSLCAKTWVSNPREKYQPGKYAPKERRDSGQWEFVQVFFGRLDCVRGSPPNEERIPVMDGGPVDLPPEGLRRWELPATDAPDAGGFAIFRPLARPMPAGQGDGHTYAAWKGEELRFLDRLPFIGTCRARYVEVFGGKAVATIRGRGGRPLVLTDGMRLFLAPSVDIMWVLWPGTFGIRLVIT